MKHIYSTGVIHDRHLQSSKNIFIVQATEHLPATNTLAYFALSVVETDKKVLFRPSLDSGKLRLRQFFCHVWPEDENFHETEIFGGKFCRFFCVSMVEATGEQWKEKKK
jgi:hypothetical protein